MARKYAVIFVLARELHSRTLHIYTSGQVAQEARLKLSALHTVGTSQHSQMPQSVSALLTGSRTCTCAEPGRLQEGGDFTPPAVRNIPAECSLPLLTMASEEASYATDLAAARSRLAALKERAAARARARGDAFIPSQRDSLSEAGGALTVPDRTTDAHGLGEEKPASELQKLIAAFLLDPANGVPLDSHKMHREVCRRKAISLVVDCPKCCHAVSSRCCRHSRCT